MESLSNTKKRISRSLSEKKSVRRVTRMKATLLA